MSSEGIRSLRSFTERDLPGFVSPERIDVKRFVEEWIRRLAQELRWLQCPAAELAKQTASDWDRPKEFINSLEKNLNLDKFATDLFKEDVSLDSLAEKFETIRHFRSVKPLKRKYKHNVVSKPAANVENKHTAQCDHQKPLAVLTVHIFRPHHRNHYPLQLELEREFQVLSCQPLTVLRDCYVCITDVVHQPDYSERPLESLPKFERHEKTGFFLINDTFYLDDRMPGESFDSILQWVTERDTSHPMKKKPMTSTKFEDLTIQLGFPYLYMHRGNCEHLLVFSDIRLYIPNNGEDDPPTNYPKATIVATINTTKCQMCNIYFAKWVTIQNKRLPVSPFYFCHNCFMTFNYDQNQKKIGSFKAFPLIFSDSLEF